MFIFILCVILTILWLSFEIWRAPLMRENPDGSWTKITETKKFSDLFKKKK